MSLKRWIIPAFFAIFFLPGNSILSGHEIVTRKRSVDLVILIDNSPSMSEVDPQDLRCSAACFLLDFLTGCSEKNGINYRVGMANFGGMLGTQLKLRALQDGWMRKKLHAERIPLTDFRPPLDWAVKTLNRLYPK